MRPWTDHARANAYRDVGRRLTLFGKDWVLLDKWPVDPGDPLVLNGVPAWFVVGGVYHSQAWRLGFTPGEPR